MVGKVESLFSLGLFSLVIKDEIIYCAIYKVIYFNNTWYKTIYPGLMQVPGPGPWAKIPLGLQK